MKRIACTLAALTLLSGQALAQEQPAPSSTDEELAKKLANPVAGLISVPLQFNYDCCVDPGGQTFLLNVQPVIPFALNDSLDLIVRTIVPFNHRDGSPSGDATGFGLGDTTQSFFFTPAPVNGLTWALGPVFYYPTGTDGYSGGQWGAGPTGIVLKQDGPLTYGILANHIWSLGAESRPDISNTFLQPFFNYTWPDSTSFIVNLESTYDWERDRWSVPLHTGISHIYKLGEQRISLGAQARVYLDEPDDGGPDWGLRFVATFLFPK